MANLVLCSFLAIFAISSVLGINVTQTWLEQQILSVQTIPDGIDIYVDSTWLSDDTTSETTILIDGDLYFTLPVGFDTDPPPDLPDYLNDIADQSLPGLLRQFGIDETEIQPLVDEYKLLATDAIVDAIAGPDGSVFEAEGIFSDVIDWVGRVITRATNIVVSTGTDVVCGVFGVVGTPFYEAVNLLFQALNSGTSRAPTTNDQDFFIFPLHGPVSHDDNIVVYYSAKFPPGFGGRYGVTMGSTIYLVYPFASSSHGGPQFEEDVRGLLHEFTHIMQYKDFGYFTPAFGAKYLFNHCRVSFYQARTIHGRDLNLHREEAIEQTQWRLQQMQTTTRWTVFSVILSATTSSLSITREVYSQHSACLSLESTGLSVQRSMSWISSMAL